MSGPGTFDEQVRAAAMAHLAEHRAAFDGKFPREFLLRGFMLGSERIPLIAAQQGIYKPRVLSLPLSILTTPAKLGVPRPYEDEFDFEDCLLYKYRGTDSNHRDNVGLRRVMEAGLPIIYFSGLRPGLYSASWPARIIGDDPKRLTFRVEVIESDLFTFPPGTAESEDPLIRKYARAQVKVRLHQRAFRTHVIAAYQTRCTVCRFAHEDMLDAAHIIPDSDPGGAPEVANGLSLCKLHHAAYDRNVLGISPDYKIRIRRDVMEEKDGPTLKHGLQEFDGAGLAVLPRAVGLRPSRENLELRFERFLKA